MTARLSFGRALAAAGVVTAVAVPFSAGSAFADIKSHHPSAPAVHSMGQPGPVHTTPVPMHTTGHHAGHQPDPHHVMVTTLRTRTRDAEIRTSPTADRHSRSISTLRMPGSKVAVTCYTMGARMHGSNVWFETVAPARGFISSSAVARPAHPVARCN
jgi:hypothetical protein